MPWVRSPDRLAPSLKSAPAGRHTSGRGEVSRSNNQTPPDSNYQTFLDGDRRKLRRDRLDAISYIAPHRRRVHHPANGL